jgi:hypothetical protein
MLFNRLSTCVLGVAFILNFIMFLFNFHISFIRQPCASNENTCYSLNRLPSVFNYSINSATPRLCIVIRVYGQQIGYLSVLALSLYHSGLENDRIFIINTDNRTDIQLLIQTISYINNFVSRMDYVTLIDLGVHSAKNDYGYDMTDRMLSYLYNNHVQPAVSICHYVTFTNGDNFYARSFGKKVLPHMKAGRDIIAWGFISHYSWPGLKEVIDYNNLTAPRIFDDGSNKCINAALRVEGVDLGAVAYRLAFLKEHQLYFCSSVGTCSFVADGLFIEKAAKLTNASVLLRQTLFVHQ